MPLFRTTAVTGLVLAAALAVPAAAQEKSCSVDEGKPSEVARAYLTLSQVVANQAAKPADQERQLAGAVKALTEKTGDVENPVGHAFELGKALVLFSIQPDIPLNVKRSTLGYTTNPDGMINLPAAIDSAFSVVEKAMPECESETIKWRSQKAWITLVNGSIQALNADELDSAETRASQSLLFNKKPPYGYMVLGQVAARRKQTDNAISYFQKTVAAAGNDSTYNEVKFSTLQNLAATASEAADAASDAATKAKYYGVAKDAYAQLVKEAPATSSYAEAAKSGLVRVSLAAGDTASVRASYAQLVANPGNYTYNEIVNAGVSAFRANDYDAATKLFQAAHEMNPFHRDALANLSSLLIRNKEYAKALPLTKRLMEVDPDGDNSRLLMLAYAGLAKEYGAANKDLVARFNKTKDAKLKKAILDSATLTADSNKVYTDLAVKLNASADSQPVKVTFNEFSNVNNKVTLAGTIENNSTTDKTFTIKVDFLDKSGATVTSQSATVGPVPGQGAGKFSITVTAPNISAFKYAPIQ
ncbi:MAG TPA: tetratricopeptide repeat protein [Gemmatimonadaceae bacterium]|jgi:tetratricopeptide (TPR) repeat protein|nr:tetratricopeptide repeat protein [Gemmatimonadaceae bacterium]